MATGPRSSPAYQRMRATVRRAHALAALPCHLCEKPIDYGLRYPHPQSWSLDHRHALHQGGALLDPTNAAASHLRCNQSRGATEGNQLRGARTAAQKALGAPPRHTSWRW